MTTLYKITDAQDCTRIDTQWGAGVTHRAEGKGLRLCTADLIHAYDHPLLAVLHNPIHGNYQPFHLWECKSDGVLHREDGLLKCGVKELTSIRRRTPPKVTSSQAVRYGIYCVQALKVSDPAWDRWAAAWLDGSDRSEEAARLASRVAWQQTWPPSALASTSAVSTLVPTLASARLTLAWSALALATDLVSPWSPWSEAMRAVVCAVKMEPSLKLIAIAKRAVADEQEAK